jgi:hypothetical protein
MGTFISEDSLLGEPRDPDSRHLYAYGGGDPVGAWDPDGKFWYKIRPGDTLWALASRFLGSGARWRAIAAVNSGRILHPRHLVVGTCIWISRPGGNRGCRVPGLPETDTDPTPRPGPAPDICEKDPASCRGKQQRDRLEDMIGNIRTAGLCTTSAGKGYVGITLTFCALRNLAGHRWVQGTVGGALVAGASASRAGTVLLSTGTRMSDQEGWFFNIGLDAGIGFGLAGQYSWGYNSSGAPITNVAVGIGNVSGLSWTVVGASYTWVTDSKSGIETLGRTFLGFDVSWWFIDRIFDARNEYLRKVLK